MHIIARLKFEKQNAILNMQGVFKNNRQNLTVDGSQFIYIQKCILKKLLPSKSGHPQPFFHITFKPFTNLVPLVIFCVDVSDFFVVSKVK